MIEGTVATNSIIKPDLFVHVDGQVRIVPTHKGNIKNYDMSSNMVISFLYNVNGEARNRMQR